MPNVTTIVIMREACSSVGRHRGKPVARYTLVMSTALGLLGALLAVAALRQIVADIYYMQSGRFLKAWQQSEKWPTREAWSITDEALKTAVRLSPFESISHFERQGEIYEWTPPGLVTPNSSRRNALYSYRRAASGQPNWPYYWIRIAEVKAELAEIDEEFYEALRHARASGGLQLETSYRIALIGVNSWDRLNGSARAATVEAIKLSSAAPTTRKLQLWRQIKQSGLALVVCQQLPLAFARENSICWY